MNTTLITLLVLLLGVSSVMGDGCPVGCTINGQCVNGECVCNEGFAGADCSFPFETCPDDILTCFNGASCSRISSRVEQSNSRSEYECDCSTVPDASPFQIQECESPEADSCEKGAQTSDYAFCTNGGKCITQVQFGEPHAGCRCPNEFEGRHCQYRKGTAPDAELKFAFAQQEHHIEGFFLFLIILVVACFVGGLGYVVIARKMSSRQPISKEEVDEALKDIALDESDYADETPHGELA